MKQIDWIVSGDTGISSKTMWAAINDADIRDYGIPHDPADFGRCYRYFKTCGLTKVDLEKVKERFKWFAPFIDNWDEIVELYESEIRQDRAPKTYDFIQQLVKESRSIR